MGFYIKKGVFPFFYVIMMSLIAMGILVISGLEWLKVILAILNVGLYVLVIGMASFKDGEDALKTQTANDMERREIIRTGEDRPLKLHEEYKPWKGFMFGFVSCVPLIILLIIHTIVYLATGSAVGVGAVAGIMYLMVYVFFLIGTPVSGGDVATSAALSWYSFYGALAVIPVIMFTTGIGYILGARKIRRQQEMIKEKKRQIYGEDS